MKSRVVLLVVVAVIIGGDVSSGADIGPQPPRESEPFPPYPDRLVIDTENTGTVRYLLLPVIPPGGIQSITFPDRESQDVRRYQSIMRTSKASNPLSAGYNASSINRAVANYRYLAGIPTDKEPPAAP